MILANIKDAERYYHLNPNFKDAFQFLKSLSEDSPEGGFEFDGFRGHVVALTTCDTTPDGNPKNAEAHRKYLDIHYVISGTEAIGYAAADSLPTVTEYFADEDYQLFSGKMQKVFLREGDFCIVFPEDAHTPGMRASGDEHLKKAVVKIAL